MKRTVVVFRAESEEYSQRLIAAGFEPTFVEALRFEPVGVDQLHARLQNSYDGLALTSVRAVDAVAALWDEPLRLLWSERRLYAVGAATGARAEMALGMRPRGVYAGCAAALAEVIAAENPSATFLFPCGETRSPDLERGLRAHGLNVEALPVYRTAEHPELARAVNELQTGARPVALIVFSPEGAALALARAGKIWAAVPVVCVGGVTATRVRRSGRTEVVQAMAPTAEAVVSALVSHLEEHKPL